MAGPRFRFRAGLCSGAAPRPETPTSGSLPREPPAFEISAPEISAPEIRAPEIRAPEISEGPESGDHGEGNYATDDVEGDAYPQEIAEAVAASAVDDQMGLVADGEGKGAG